MAEDKRGVLQEGIFDYKSLKDGRVFLCIGTKSM